MGQAGVPRVQREGPGVAAPGRERSACAREIGTVRIRSGYRAPSCGRICVGERGDAGWETVERVCSAVGWYCALCAFVCASVGLFRGRFACVLFLSRTNFPN